ncbi:hypothetical protein V5F44_09260 [Xanthobacter sp. V2C-8]|uniref:hypothetical protein n=1 Tax=Xanthobacter albus TaxID=3119929 RepID=UPI0037269D44
MYGFFYFQLASDIQAGGIVLIQILERLRFEGHRLLPPDDEMRGEAGGRLRARLRMKVIVDERRRFRYLHVVVWQKGDRGASAHDDTEVF